MRDPSEKGKRFPWALTWHQHPHGTGVSQGMALVMFLEGVSSLSVPHHGNPWSAALRMGCRELGK